MQPTPNISDVPGTCLSVPQLAEFLSVSRATVDRSIAAGIFPHRRIRGRIVFSPSDIRNILEMSAWGPRSRRRGTR